MVIGATILAVTAFTEINGEDTNGNHEGGWDSLWAKYECAYAQDFKNSSDTITGRVLAIISTIAESADRFNKTFIAENLEKAHNVVAFVTIMIPFFEIRLTAISHGPE